MKIERKEGIRGVRIVEHNKKVLYAIIILAIALVFVVGLIIKAPETKMEKNISEVECSSNADCVPASCCHAASCVSKENAPKCRDVFCSAVCEPNTMDCGQGRCECLNNKCTALIK